MAVWTRRILWLSRFRNAIGLEFVGEKCAEGAHKAIRLMCSVIVLSKVYMAGIVVQC